MSVPAGTPPPPAAAVALMVATAVPGLFGFFCPGVLDAGKHPDAAVRLQQTKAGVASLALGAAGSAATKTPWPFILSLTLVCLVLWEYRTAPQQETS